MPGEPRPDVHPGDVVRAVEDGSLAGVVLYVGQYSYDPPRYELHVDMPGKGAGIWSPDAVVVANDADSIAEAKRLGLRFPVGHEPPAG